MSFLCHRKAKGPGNLHRLLKILVILLVFASCKTPYEYNGDLLAVLNQNTTSLISFKKDLDSPVALEMAYTIGKNLTAADLPGKNNPVVKAFRPGFDVSGWKLEENTTDLSKYFTFDNSGKIQTLHISPVSYTLYVAGYVAATDTPYKIVYKIQNASLNGYDLYREKNCEGKTSTPEDPSYTNAASDLPQIKGFVPRTDLIEEQEILYDGTTVVEVLYDRKTISLTIDDPQTGYSDTLTGAYGLEVPYNLTALERPGYEILQWTQKLTGAESKTVDSLPQTYPEDNYTYEPVWTAQEVAYKVVHKKQKTSLTDYEVEEEENLSGYTGTLTQAVTKNYTGFELSSGHHTGGSVTQETIDGDGTTIVTIYYDRKTYSLTLNGNGGQAAGSDELVLSGAQGFVYQVPKALPANTFERSGYTFLGWAASAQNAGAGTVDYNPGDNYTIAAANAVLYAVWQANEISITIELPDDGAEVTIQSSVEGNVITLTAQLPQGSNAGDFTYKWFYTDKGSFQVESTNQSWTIDTSGWTEGYYQISLIAQHTATSALSGGTVQIHVGN